MPNEPQYHEVQGCANECTVFRERLFMNLSYDIFLLCIYHPDRHTRKNKLLILYFFVLSIERIDF